MAHVRIIIEYDGTDFCGWQIQPGRRTVQGEIEDALKRLTGKAVRITGAGRTDTGVHARGQVAHFQELSELPLSRLQKALNAMTGDDVYVKQVDRVAEDFHSRFSAVSKTYCYSILQVPSPLRNRYAWYTSFTLDVPSMKRVIPSLLGTHDFKHFSVHNGNENTECCLKKIDITEAHSELCICIEGDRFLRKMMRGIIGFLYDVGRGRFASRDIDAALAGNVPDLYFVPTCGLVLCSVQYPDRYVIEDNPENNVQFRSEHEDT
ncbi:MAG: tRNA pseudouridine(38-40) synthase TruA [candidate division WOR-3 bacterium]|nr:MAG: tRNA pseudouridine(38-40) synthase TruA [candidate division WOR-3 bacterium]